jgi:phenolic acid decarboxylase
MRAAALCRLTVYAVFFTAQNQHIALAHALRQQFKAYPDLVCIFILAYRDGYRYPIYNQHKNTS